MASDYSYRPESEPELVIPTSVADGEDRLLTPGEVAGMFRVDPKTVTRWASHVPPRILSIRTPGGHRRFRESEVKRRLGELG